MRKRTSDSVARGSDQIQTEACLTPADSSQSHGTSFQRAREIAGYAMSVWGLRQFRARTHINMELNYYDVGPGNVS